MAEVAQTSAASEWEEGEGPKCAECGAEMKGVGKHKRKLQAGGGGEVELEREYAKCPACRAGIFPLDEELELLPGNLTPHGHERLVRLGAWMLYEKAADMMTGLMGVEISQST